MPRVRDSLICVLSNIPFVMRVLKMASFICAFSIAKVSFKTQNSKLWQWFYLHQMLTSSRVGTLLKARAFAESHNLNVTVQHINKNDSNRRSAQVFLLVASYRSKCSSSLNTFPLYIRRPSHIESPPCTTESKTETLNKNKET